MASKRAIAGALWGAGGVGALVAAVGLLHLPCARSLLMRAGGCPLAGARLSLAQSEKARHISADAERGTGAAPARPALVFALDDTTFAQARAWARANRLDCEEPRDGAMRCDHVPPQSLGLSATAPSDAQVWLEFNARGKLVNVSTFRSHLPPDVAASTVRQITASLASRLGHPTGSVGGFDADHLAQPAAASVASVSYRFGDYIADVSALNFQSSGVAVHEQYTSARD